MTQTADSSTAEQLLADVRTWQPELHAHPSVWRAFVDKVYDRLRDDRTVDPSVRQRIWHELHIHKIRTVLCGATEATPYVPHRLAIERASGFWPLPRRDRPRCLTTAEAQSMEWFPATEDL